MTTRVFLSGDPGELPVDVTLDAGESHYLVRVRRSRAGERVEALDGAGLAWRATIEDADARQARLRLVERLAEPRPEPRFHLLLAPPEPAATLDALAAATALGVDAITLVQSERAFHQTPGEERIRRVLRATLRQCGRRSPPTVDGPTELQAALDAATGQRFVASPNAHAATPAVRPSEGTVLLVGPEGGLTRAEEERATALGFVPLHLGPWTLETPIAVSAAVSRLRGAQGATELP